MFLSSMRSLSFASDLPVPLSSWRNGCGLGEESEDRDALMPVGSVATRACQSPRDLLRSAQVVAQTCAADIHALRAGSRAHRYSQRPPLFGAAVAALTLRLVRGSMTHTVGSWCLARTTHTHHSGAPPTVPNGAARRFPFLRTWVRPSLAPQCPPHCERQMPQTGVSSSLSARPHDPWTQTGARSCSPLPLRKRLVRRSDLRRAACPRRPRRDHRIRELDQR